VVIPAFQEGDAVIPVLAALEAAVPEPMELLVVVDFLEDSTVRAVAAGSAAAPSARVLISDYGRGPANAIRYGIDHASAPCVVVTMADASDDPGTIPAMVDLVESGNVIAAGSRYMPGGAQMGGRRVKSLMSRTAGLSLHLLTRVGTRDATNSFKAYSAAFVRSVGVESDAGFEIAIELVAKARRRRLPVAEVPTVWHDRDAGQSRFQLLKWLPRYIRWYMHAFGRQLPLEPGIHQMRHVDLTDKRVRDQL
jgi:glycosyltransferase involved in cell wall biosynthesis